MAKNSQNKANNAPNAQKSNDATSKNSTNSAKSKASNASKNKSTDSTKDANNCYQNRLTPIVESGIVYSKNRLQSNFCNLFFYIKMSQEWLTVSGIK